MEEGMTTANMVIAALATVGVVVLGGINIDLVTLAHRFPEAGETVVGDRFLTYPGGKGANQAVAAAADTVYLVAAGLPMQLKGPVKGPDFS